MTPTAAITAIHKALNDASNALMECDRDGDYPTIELLAAASVAVDAQAAELVALRAVALQHIAHTYEGDCPDELDRSRSDKNCPACRVLDAAKGATP